MPEQAILFIRIYSTIEKVDRKKTVIFLLLQPKHSKIESADTSQFILWAYLLSFSMLFFVKMIHLLQEHLPK